MICVHLLRIIIKWIISFLLAHRGWLSGNLENLLLRHLIILGLLLWRNLRRSCCLLLYNNLLRWLLRLYWISLLLRRIYLLWILLLKIVCIKIKLECRLMIQIVRYFTLILFVIFKPLIKFKQICWVPRIGRLYILGRKVRVGLVWKFWELIIYFKSVPCHLSWILTFYYLR
jgi:hypothetical protein